MGKDIIIQESGEPKTLSSIDKIITPKVGGGSAEWVLFENLDLMAKTVTKNGTYKAEDDNVYGYHKVTVKVPKKSKKKTGKRPQSSGDPNDYSVTTDDEGNLVYKKLPTSINIITPPSKLTYSDGELIKKDGMAVKAYYADGGLWGDVPLGEIVLDPNKADYSKSQQSNIYETPDGFDVGSVHVDGKLSCIEVVGGAEYIGGASPTAEETALYNQMRNNAIYGYSDDAYLWTSTFRDIRNYFMLRNARVTAFYDQNGLGHVITACNSGGETIAYSIGLHFTYNESGSSGGEVTTYPSSFTHDGKTVWFHSGGSDNVFPSAGAKFPIGTVHNYANNGSYHGAIAWEMWYGASSTQGDQEIDAKWARPEDQKILKDSFNIKVHQ